MTWIDERLADISGRARAWPLQWEARGSSLHLICTGDGQSVYRVDAGLAFNLGGMTVHVAAHLRQCHDDEPV